MNNCRFYTFLFKFKVNNIQKMPLIKALKVFAVVIGGARNHLPIILLYQFSELNTLFEINLFFALFNKKFFKICLC